MKIQIVILAIILSLFSTVSCRKDTDITITEETTISGVNGFITNEENFAVGQAEVIINGASFITDDFGYFNAENVSHNGKIVLKVNKAGYFSGSRTIFTRSNEKTFTQVSLIKQYFPYKLVSTVGRTIEMNDLVTLTFPPNAIVDKNGNNFNGFVAVVIKYLDPTLHTMYNEMPGALIGQNQNKQDVVLESYGMIGVWLSDFNGNSLNLKPGEKCKMTTKIPETMRNYAPTVMPLWHFDESAGIWIEEGSATRDGDYYVGEVSHFSYWNFDYPRPLVHIKGKLTNGGDSFTEGIVSIGIEGQNAQRTSNTNALGEFEGFVPANEKLSIQVHNSCNTLIYSSNIGPFTSDQDLGNIIVANTNSEITITGQVVGCDGLPSPNAIIRYKFLSSKNEIVADDAGRFSIKLQNCKKSIFEMDAISMNDEKQSNLIKLGTSIKYDNIVIKACDKDVDEYIRVTFSNGDKFNIFHDIHGVEGYEIISYWDIEKGSFKLSFDKKAIVNSPMNSQLLFKTESYQYKNLPNNGKTTFTSFVSDYEDKINYSEGSFVLNNVTKYEQLLGGNLQVLETGLTATGTFRYKNDK